MTGALDAGLRDRLLALARRDALLAFDFDGTLAPLVDDPASAALLPATRARLGRLAARGRCAVLSGRGLADLSRRVDGLPLIALVGNHGIEVRGLPPAGDASPEALRKRVGAWAAELSGLPAAVPGLVVEDKGYSLTLHLRGAREPERAEAAARAAACRLPGARVFGGHAAVNVVPADAPDKGDALRRLMDATRAEAALYVGDDETDECAFALARELPLLGIRVGPVAATRAAWVLPSREQVDEILDVLIDAPAK